MQWIYLKDFLRDLPSMINKRLSDLSCNEEEYEKSKPLYETAINESGYKTTLTYTKTTNVNNRNRVCNIIYYDSIHLIAKMLTSEKHFSS